MKKLVIAGANGFISRHLTRYFSNRDWHVYGLARRAEGLDSQCHYVEWDGKKLGDWMRVIDGCDVLINMAGRSINCRHNDENKRQILESRVDSTRVLGEAVAQCKNPPSLWVNASAAGIYQQSYTETYGESGEYGSDFMADVVKTWEKTFFTVSIPTSVRRVALRTTMVVSNEPGNAYRYLNTLAKFGLGGKAGNGKQIVSWIHIEDVSPAIEYIMNHEDLTGPVNMTAPEVVSNTEMMSRFRKSVGALIGLPAPAWGVRIGAYLIGTAPELVLNSYYVIPNKLLERGFVFKYAEMRPEEW